MAKEHDLSLKNINHYAWVVLQKGPQQRENIIVVVLF
jgi:hypothetical protein